MPTSDEELDQLKNSVEKKRERLAAERSKRAAHEANLNNDLVALQLKAEEARLDADLALVAQQSSAKAAKEGASAPMEAAREEMKRAVAAQEAASAPPPTSSDNEGSDTQEKGK